LINSLSNANALVAGVYLIPKGFTGQYYQELIQMSGIPRSIFISVSRTILGTTITVSLSTFLGYMVTQQELPFRKIIYRFVVITMFFSAGLIPWYILMLNIGFKNNYLLYIIPGAVNAYFMILSKTFFESIPGSIEESAKIDGAGVLTIFAKLILPMSLPIVACLTVFCAVGQWNAWQDNFYLVNKVNLFTLQYRLYMLMANANATATQVFTDDELLRDKVVSAIGLRYAMSIATITPIFLVYPFMQKYFVKGIMLGAVKG